MEQNTQNLVSRVITCFVNSKAKQTIHKTGKSRNQKYESITAELLEINDFELRESQ